VKVIISYPPLDNQKGCPTLGQNRQFQFFKEPTYIYPVVPATAATLLKKAGYEVVWNDCLAEGWDHARFLKFIQEQRPDLVVFETKTPVIKQLWRVINDIKGLPLSHPSVNLKAAPKVALFGDHVTALPEESFQNSGVDFVLTGGDYDFLLLNLCNCLNGQLAISDKRAGLEAGVYYRQDNQIKNTGKFRLGHDLNSLPFIDRDLTKWHLYAYENGNYKRRPGTYIMSARDCWYHQCTFCSWPTLYPYFRTRSPVNVLDEIGSLINQYGIREIMDDSGTLPVEGWLGDFCRGMIERGYSRQLKIDCNMRFGALSLNEYRLMKKAGFRLLLFGLESANQPTLDRLKKGIKVEEVIEGCRLATQAGLNPHITIMFGYPWETYQDALKTLNLGKWLLRKGYAYTMQATMVIPYPGTPLFEECRQNNLLKTTDWDEYDMRDTVMQVMFPQEKVKGLVQAMYRASFHPEFILRKVCSLRDTDDFRYYLRAIRKVWGHIFDFKHNDSKAKAAA